MALSPTRVVTQTEDANRRINLTFLYGERPRIASSSG